MNFSKTKLLSVGLVFVSAVSAKAALPEPGKLKIGSSDVALNAYLDTNFQYNFNKPPVSTNIATTTQNSLRAYDRGHNQFTLNQARIGVSKNSDNVGFDVQIGTGSQLDVLNTPDTQFSTIRRAMLMWEDDGLYVHAGRFDADFGKEQIDAVENLNYSRSYQFTLTHPKVLNGLRLGYSTGKASLDATVSNGVNRTAENNRGKDYLARLRYSFGDSLVGLSYSAGTPNTNNSSNWRHRVTAYGDMAVTQMFGLGVDATFLHDTKTLFATETANGANIYGGGLYGAVKFLRNQKTTARAEWLHDHKGVFLTRRKAADLLGFTLTHRWMVTSNLSFWGEVRWDHSSNKDFNDRGGSSLNSNQVTALVAGTFNI